MRLHYRKYKEMALMIKIITELQAIAQSGLAYSKDQFDIGRFNRILEIAAQLFSEHSPHKYEEILALFTSSKGYATPKVDIRSAVFKEDKILLVREKTDNLWSLPGGWADVNLTPAENALKEIKEEAGYECKVINLIGIYDKNKNNDPLQWPYIYKIFFQCEVLSGPYPFDEGEIQEVGFFALEEIPELSKARVNYEQIEKCFLHYKQPQTKPYFE